MSVTTVDAFWDALAESTLLTDEQLQEAREQLGEDADAKTIARQLVKDGLLTRWQAGQLLAGRKSFYLSKYLLYEPLGASGQGRVFHAEHPQMGRHVALKVISRRHADDDSVVNFVKEAQAIASLNHRNLIHVFDVDREGQYDYLVMEHVTGRDLRRMVREDGPLDADVAADCIRQAALGLDHAHERGMVHCGIRPKKLLLDERGTVKVIGMGVARLASKEDDTDRERASDASYTSPEQAAGQEEFDHRADIYSLGCTMYFLLTGRPPFNKGTAEERGRMHVEKNPPAIERLRDDVPEDLIAICRKMMAKQPADRYETAEDVAEALDAWLAENVAEEPLPAPTRPPRSGSHFDHSEETEDSVDTADTLGFPAISTDAGPIAAADDDFAGQGQPGQNGAAATSPVGPAQVSGAKEAGSGPGMSKPLMIGLILGGVLLLVGASVGVTLLLVGGGAEPVAKQDDSADKPAPSDGEKTDDEATDDDGATKDDGDTPADEKSPDGGTAEEPGDGPAGVEQPGDDGGEEKQPADGPTAGTDGPQDGAGNKPDGPEPDKSPPGKSEPGQDGNSEGQDAGQGGPDQVAKVDPPVDKGTPTDPPKKDPPKTEPPKKNPGKKPPRKGPKPKPKKSPFRDLPEKFDLPEPVKLAAGSSDVPEAVKIGVVHLEPNDPVFALLSGGDTAARGSTSFALRLGGGSRDWEVVVKESPADADGQGIGYLSLSGEDLTFRWDPRAGEIAASNYLQNCLLKIEAQGKTHHIVLRKPLPAPPLKIDLKRGVFSSDVSIPWTPEPDRVKVVFSKLGQEFPKDYKIAPKPVLSGTKLTLDATAMYKLSIHNVPQKFKLDAAAKELSVVQAQYNQADLFLKQYNANKKRIPRGQKKLYEAKAQAFETAKSRAEEAKNQLLEIGTISKAIHDAAEIHYRVEVYVDGGTVVLADSQLPPAQ